MTPTHRREVLGWGAALLAMPGFALLGVGCSPGDDGTKDNNDPATDNRPTDRVADMGATMKIQYLEIVSPDVDALCQTYEQVQGVKFGEPEAALGNARTAKLSDGSLLGVRAPLRDSEQPVVRPYLLVDDIEAAVKAAAASGAVIALPPMPLGSYGTCAIFIQGGIEHGLWQL